MGREIDSICEYENDFSHRAAEKLELPVAVLVAVPAMKTTNNSKVWAVIVDWSVIIIQHVTPGA